mgnify:CR=1 FL=1
MRADVSASGLLVGRVSHSRLTPRAHAIECRIYAEDPDNNFLPSPGRIVKLQAPQGPGVRDDSGATEGLEVAIFYDPMISKLITWGDDRPQALARMRRALREYEVHGIKTTIPFFTWALDDPDFIAGRFDTSFIDRKLVRPVMRARAVEPGIENLPMDESIAPTPRAKAIMALRSAPEVVGRPYVMPPGTPEALVRTMREAFAKAIDDKELIAEAKKAKMDLNFVNGDEALKVMHEVLNQPKDIVEEFAKYIKFGE